MKRVLKNSTLSLALAASLIGSATWSTDSHACAAEPLIGSVCIMATPASGWNNISGFVLAQGQTLPINQYQALYSILGITWGGDGRTTVGVPNLAGRVVVGSGIASGKQYTAGITGGAESVALTTAQLPAHTHTFSNAVVDFSKATATTTLSGLSGTLTGNLALKASTGGTVANDPTGRTLATTTTGGPLKIYSDAAPTISMNTASIDSSNLKVGTISGSATTTLGGTAGVSGITAPTGSGATVSLMQPYLVMNYYLSTSGIYPQRN